MNRPLTWSFSGRRFKLSLKSYQAAWGILFVLPAVFFFTIFWIYPLLNSIRFSLTDWDLLTPAQFVGLENYLKLPKDQNFIMAVRATLYYAVGTGIPTALLALMLALLVNRKLPGRGFFRTAFFIPAVTSWIVTAIVWRMIYLPDNGLYLLFTEPFGIRGVRWLVSRGLAMPAVIIMAVWKQVGPNMIIFLAGLQNLPDEIFEAALVDGASARQVLWHITLPLLKPTTLFVMIMLVIGAFQTFTPIYVLTGGGPANVTRVLSMLVYQEGFTFYHMGKASAISLVMLAAVMLFTVVNLRVFRSDV